MDVSNEAVNNSANTGVLALFAGIGIMMWIVISIALYIYFALVLTKLAEKTEIKDAWWAWVPILNVFLMLKIAKKPLWWFILLLISPINIIFAILVWMAITENVKKPNWWGVLMIVPGLNIIVPGYLAFSKN